MKKTPFQFSLQALLTLREADKREVELRILSLQSKLKRAKANVARRRSRISDTVQRIGVAVENLRSPAGVRMTGEAIRERSRVLAELRALREAQEARARQKDEVVRLFQGRLRVQEQLRRELQAEIDELDRVRQEELRQHKRAQERREERARDEDQILRQNRRDDE